MNKESVFTPYKGLLGTDFYQISMATAYLLLDQADNRAGFEAFVRHIKPTVTTKESYVFYGEQDVADFIKQVRRELQSTEFIDRFIHLISPKLPADKRDGYGFLLREKLQKAKKDFQFSVVPNRSIVYPYIPVFQYNGPIWIGQLLETPILNIINGQTGAATRFNVARTYHEFAEINALQDLTGRDDISSEYYKFYQSLLIQRAEEYRAATPKVILEAAFRRAPGFTVARSATNIALSCGWNGTSNTAANADAAKVNGTMAHSFVMSQKDELTAFKLWNSIFPNSTILVDTYDVLAAIDMLIENDIKPACIRIDSAPLDTYAIKARSLMDFRGWKDVQIFLSGDITPELLQRYHAAKIPFDRVMAGTEYVNISDAKGLNAGFVYKLVEIEDSDGIRFPLKKATGKTNYAGLKTIGVKEGVVIVSPGFGLHAATHIKPGMATQFAGLAIGA